MRICSFLPSATEIIYALGLDENLYGVTHECDYPSQARDKPIIVRSVLETSDRSSSEVDQMIREYSSEGTPIYKIDHEALEQAQPDLVISQGLCEVCAVSANQVEPAIESLSRPPQVLYLDPHSIDDMFADILKVGAATDRGPKSEELVQSLRARVDMVTYRVAISNKKPSVACLEWLDPLFAGGHWIPEMVELAGGRNSFGSPGEPSLLIQWQQLVEAQPEIVVAMPCGFDLLKGMSEVNILTDHKDWESLPAAGDNGLFVVDGGAYFSRSGPRLVDGLEIMAEIIHPELFSGLIPRGGACRIYGQLVKIN